MLIINEEFEEAVNCMVLSNDLKQSNLDVEEEALIKALLLNFYGLNIEGL